VSTDGQTHTHTHARTDAKRCPMLYAIAMGQIMILFGRTLTFGEHAAVKMLGEAHSASAITSTPLWLFMPHTGSGAVMHRDSYVEFGTI